MAPNALAMSRAPSTFSAARRLHSRVGPLVVSWHVPPSGSRGKFLADVGPIVKCRGIEVRIVRPDDSTNLRVEPDRMEGGQVLQRLKQRTMQHRPEVDALLG